MLGQSKGSNEFLMQKSVLKVVLHLHVDLEPKKLGFSSWPAAAIFDLAIMLFLVVWQESTSQ